MNSPLQQRFNHKRSGKIIPWCLLTLSLTSLEAPSANAHVYLLGDEDGNSGSPVDLYVGGTLKLGYEDATGHASDDSVARRGYADGSDFHAGINYHFAPGWQAIGYYEMEGSYFRALRVKGHYHHNRDGYDDTFTHQLYAGIASDRYGILTFGQQLNPFYTAVGAKTDIWIMDMTGQGPGQGIDPHGTYDASYRANSLLSYQKQWGATNIYVSLLLPGEHFETPDFNRLRYSRKTGIAAAVDTQLTPDLSWATGFSVNRAGITNADEEGQKKFTQHMIGSSFLWTPEQWTIAGMLGHYRNFIPHEEGDASKPVFHSSTLGAEAYVGRNFPVEGALVKNVEPYIAAASMRSSSYKRNDQFVGLKFELPHKVQLNVEHRFAHNTGTNESDVTHAQLVYEI